MGGLYEDKIVKTLSTGEVMIFDTRAKCLYLIAKAQSGSWSTSSQDLETAEAYVQAGNAQKLTKEELATLTDALRQIVLLE